jgi:H/ACA ribonucleoprotein complex subunit 3
MMSEVFIGSAKKRFKPDPSKSIGKGGEADIFDVGDGTALKLFKPPNHPDYEGLPHEQDGARKRIDEHQQKLPAFPKGLPARLVAPLELAYLRNGSIAGYTMLFKKGSEVLLRYGEVNFRKSGISDDDVVKIFKDLHDTFHRTHERGYVFGDANDLNILVKGTEAYVIDADSGQFGKFLCRVFTEKFVDPLLCDPKLDRLLLYKPHNEMSDWYAYAVMLMQTLLCISGGPYGGVYKPKNHSNSLGHSARPLHRITVFHPDVRYPKPSRHFSVLPDQLLQYFHLVFEKDKREILPSVLLENLHWTTCSTCGMLHARGVCPKCVVPMPKAVTAVSTKTVSAERTFRTEGHIIYAVSQDNTLRWLTHHKGEYRREDGSLVTTGPLDPHGRFRIRGADTVIASGTHGLVYHQKNQTTERLTVDTFGLLPVIDANRRHVYWAENGQIKRTSNYGVGYYENVGDVLSQQTLFWTGPDIGFGFYRAGGISQCFIFDPERKGMNDSLTLKPFKGQLIDSTCFFGKDRIWFLVSNRVSGKTINSCYLIRHDGTVEARAETEADDGSWLGALRGKCAVGDFLLVATDDGIVRVKASGGTLAIEKEFPDSARFVHANRHLFVDKSGLMVVGSHEIWRLTMK